MKIASWLLATLFLVPTVQAEDSALPEAYAPSSRFYDYVLSSVLDIDAILEKAGVKVYACRLENGLNHVSHRGVGACLYESINYTFKENKASTISLWVLNSEGQYLPPLKLEWKNSHRSWFKFGGEFVFMSFENFFGLMVRKTNNLISESPDNSSQCKVATLPNRDLGNFLGELVISIPKGRKISEYFVFSKLDGIMAEKFVLSTKTPAYIDKKRTYQVRGHILNDKSEMIEISLLTNYNLVAKKDGVARDSCFTGNLKIPNLTGVLVKP